MAATAASASTSTSSAAAISAAAPRGGGGGVGGVGGGIRLPFLILRPSIFPHIALAGAADGPSTTTAAAPLSGSAAPDSSCRGAASSCRARAAGGAVAAAATPCGGRGSGACDPSSCRRAFAASACQQSGDAPTVREKAAHIKSAVQHASVESRRSGPQWAGRGALTTRMAVLLAPAASASAAVAVAASAAASAAAAASTSAAAISPAGAAPRGGGGGGGVGGVKHEPRARRRHEALAHILAAAAVATFPTASPRAGPAAFSPAGTAAAIS
jgi:hypothetical protein